MREWSLTQRDIMSTENTQPESENTETTQSTKIESTFAQFNFKEAVSKVVIDLSLAHFWDITAVYSLDMAVMKFRREGAKVEIIGLNRASETIIDRFGVHDKPEQLERVLGGH